MEISNSVSALGLYSYGCEHPGGGLFNSFYYSVMSQLQSWGLKATYIGAEGNGCSGKLNKVGGRAHDKLLASGFADVSVLSVAVNPAGSDDPSYDSFISASLSYVEPNRELLACFVVNGSFVKLNSAEYDQLLRSQVGLWTWSFGYGFTSSVERQPDFHILGLDNGRLNADEYESLCAWHAANGSVRSSLIRNVYPYNVLNNRQLDACVSEGLSLRQFAQCQPYCALTQLTEYGLHVWQIPESEVGRVRQSLVASPVLITR